jgi:nicotinamidase-related amidase
MQHESVAPRRALLVIDMQVGLFRGPEVPYEGDAVLARIVALIERASTAGAPIFAARHTGPAGSPIEAGSARWQLLPELGLDGERDPHVARVFDKTRPSCFYRTPLGAWLHEAAIGEIVVVGMKTQYCVDTTCRAAADLGVRAVLVADAHTTMDTPALPARAIVDHHNATLHGPFADLVTTDDCRF